MLPPAAGASCSIENDLLIVNVINPMNGELVKIDFFTGKEVE
jgi:hypothetical protein